MAALETREDQNPIADISESVGTTLEGQVVGTPPGILHPLPAPDPLHAPGDEIRELEEFGHLFGDARFRTIRAHCLAYEGMRKIGLQNLPWTAGDVRHLMNQAVTLEVTPAKLQKWWGTLKWLSIRLGVLNVDEHKQLLQKRKAIQETLVDTQVKPQRKAVVPTRAIVWALEQGAEGTPPENRVPELTKAVDRYIMAMARFNLACSARFNDVQHTSPQTVKSTSNTLELLAWQTKTTSAVAIKRNPVPLIAPLFSFSGARWWIPLERWWKRFRASEEFREMDYLIPTINKDRTGFIPRPGTPDRSLRWLKDALGKQGAPVKDVAELSWYSFRVFMPDWAFQAHIPRGVSGTSLNKAFGEAGHSQSSCPRLTRTALPASSCMDGSFWRTWSQMEHTTCRFSRV